MLAPRFYRQFPSQLLNTETYLMDRSERKLSFCGIENLITKTFIKEDITDAGNQDDKCIRCIEILSVLI
jgi:hypothetical protein